MWKRLPYDEDSSEEEEEDEDEEDEYNEKVIDPFRFL
jgi:hypothetical protein